LNCKEKSLVEYLKIERSKLKAEKIKSCNDKSRSFHKGQISACNYLIQLLEQDHEIEKDIFRFSKKINKHIKLNERLKRVSVVEEMEKYAEGKIFLYERLARSAGKKEPAI
jgi:hypothetical protein